MITEEGVDIDFGILLTQSLISVIWRLVVLVLLSSAFAGCFKRTNQRDSRDRITRAPPADPGKQDGRESTA